MFYPMSEWVARENRSRCGLTHRSVVTQAARSWKGANHSRAPAKPGWCPSSHLRRGRQESGSGVTAEKVSGTLHTTRSREGSSSASS